MRYLKQSHSQRQKVEQWLQEQGGVRNWEFLSNGYRVLVWEDERVLEMDGSDGCTTV